MNTKKSPAEELRAEKLRKAKALEQIVKSKSNTYTLAPRFSDKMQKGRP